MKALGTNFVISTALLFWLQVVLPVHSEPQTDGQQSSCITPSGVPGNCMKVDLCTEVVQYLETRPPDAFQYLQQLCCGYSGATAKVCCAINGGDRRHLYAASTLDGSTNSLLPRECGNHNVRNLSPATEVGIREFPWTALIEYQKPQGISAICGGSLISKRYVLTAAQCVSSAQIRTDWYLTSVRLGEFDKSTELDCISKRGWKRTCADPTVVVGVEETFLHEEYLPNANNQPNDIALIRLSRDVVFTDFVRPVCLPSSSSTIQRSLYVVGWGLAQYRSSVKVKSEIPLVDDAPCRNKYNGVSINLIDSQVCAGGLQNQGSCRADAGGPLMSVETNNAGTRQWTVVGVVSFGPSPCGAEDWPDVYTRVSSFVPWILSKMRA